MTWFGAALPPSLAEAAAAEAEAVSARESSCGAARIFALLLPMGPQLYGVSLYRAAHWPQLGHP
jgi:hypothetical protein